MFRKIIAVKYKLNKLEKWWKSCMCVCVSWEIGKKWFLYLYMSRQSRARWDWTIVPEQLSMNVREEDGRERFGLFAVNMKTWKCSYISSLLRVSSIMFSGFFNYYLTRARLKMHSIRFFSLSLSFSRYVTTAFSLNWIWPMLNYNIPIIHLNYWTYFGFKLKIDWVSC